MAWSLLLSCAAFCLAAGQFLLAVPILEGPDAYSHYQYVRTIQIEHRFPLLGEAENFRTAEAGQPPLFYLIAAAISAPISSADLDNVAPGNPHGGERQFDYNKNTLFHRPFSGFPHGAELAVRIIEAFGLACGLGTVACTVLLARTVFPTQPLLWLGSGAALAAVPGFAGHEVVVSNDAQLALLCSVTLLFLALWWKDRSRHWSWLAAIGIALGALTKLNAVGLVPIYGVVAWQVEGTVRGKLAAAARLLLALCLIYGWWVVYDVVVYGDPTGQLAANRAYQGQGYRPFILSVDRFRFMLGELGDSFHSFFFKFGVYNVDSAGWYAVFAVLGSIGLIAGMAQFARGRSGAARGFGGILWGWPAIVLLETAAYGYISNGGGRYLFPAVAPLAIVAARGWQAVLRNTSVVVAATLATAVIGLSGASAWLAVAPHYGYPPTVSELPAGARQVHATFDGMVELIGVDGPDIVDVAAGHSYPLTLYWRASAPEGRALSSFIHFDVPGNADSPIASYEGTPGGGRFPPSFWKPGEIVVDRYQFTVGKDSRPDKRNTLPISVDVGMYYIAPGAGTQVQPVSVDPRDAASRGLPVALWKLRGSNVPPEPSQPLARFSGALDLLDAATLLDGASLTVDLRWEAPSRPAHDFTVFVQLLSPDNTVLAQDDSYPLRGTYPTSQWSQGEQVFDTVRLPLTKQPQPGDQLIAGLYTLPAAERISTLGGQTFVRLSLPGPS